MKGQKVGYVRVSSIDQNTVRQLDGIELDKKFEDKASGKDLKRPQLDAALSHCREGDVLFVHSLDRLARNLSDLLKTVETFNAKGVEIRFSKENLAFPPGGDSNPMAKLMLQLLGAVAEFERNLIRERQQEGIELAKRRGVYAGRKKSLSPQQASEISSRICAGEKVTHIARELKVTRQTIYQYLKSK